MALTISKLKIVIDAEYEYFVCLLHDMLRIKCHEAEGNNFHQFIHDRCTLSNKHKYQAFGLKFTDSCYQTNHVFAILFGRIWSSTNQSVNLMVRKDFQAVTGWDFDNIYGSSVQDATAKGVARFL